MRSLENHIQRILQQFDQAESETGFPANKYVHCPEPSVQSPRSSVQRPESNVQGPTSRVQRPTLVFRVQKFRYAIFLKLPFFEKLKSV